MLTNENFPLFFRLRNERNPFFFSKLVEGMNPLESGPGRDGLFCIVWRLLAVDWLLGAEVIVPVWPAGTEDWSSEMEAVNRFLPCISDSIF